MASPYSTQPNLPVVVPRDEPSMPAQATGTLFVLASGFGIGALVVLFGFLFLVGIGQIGHPATSGPTAAAQSAATEPVTERITTVSVSIISLPNFTPLSIGPVVTPVAANRQSPRTISSISYFFFGSLMPIFSVRSRSASLSITSRHCI